MSTTSKNDMGYKEKLVIAVIKSFSIATILIMVGVNTFKVTYCIPLVLVPSSIPLVPFSGVRVYKG